MMEQSLVIQRLMDIRCKNIKVSSDSVMYAEADGESLGHTPAEFSIIPASD